MDEALLGLSVLSSYFATSGCVRGCVCVYRSLPASGSSSVVNTHTVDKTIRTDAAKTPFCLGMLRRSERHPLCVLRALIVQSATFSVVFSSVPSYSIGMEQRSSRRSARVDGMTLFSDVCLS